MFVAMDHEISTTTTLINVAVQAINLILFFLLFKYMFWGKIINWLQERKELIGKLQNADEEYKNIVDQAELAAKEIIIGAQETKKTMLEEATGLAKKKADEILDQANNKAEDLVSTAKVQAKTLESDLKNNYEYMVKTTAGSYLKKIFDTEPELQNAYMDKVMKGFLEN